jgi:hypothetical protein
MDKIGTGEGAQAYGHGLYFAENEGVARSYKSALGGKRNANFKPSQFSNISEWRDEAAKLFPGDQQRQAAFQFFNQMPSRQAALNEFDFIEKSPYAKNGFSFPDAYGKEVKFSRADFENLLDEFYAGEGRMYEVNIDANPDDFLDYDAPLSKQSPKVREAAEKELRRYYGSQFDGQVGNTSRRPLGELLDDADRDQVRRASQLKEAGIPGIKYLDAGSRSAGDGSRNYVVFDDKLISIVKKYGVAALVAAGVLDQVQGEELKARGYN